MAAVKVSLLNVYKDIIQATEGSGDESTIAEFNRNAEALNDRASKIGSVLGMSSLSCCVTTDDLGGFAFRFANSSAEDFDARALVVKGKTFKSSSLLAEIN